MAFGENRGPVAVLVYSLRYGASVESLHAIYLQSRRDRMDIKRRPVKISPVTLGLIVNKS